MKTALFAAIWIGVIAGNVQRFESQSACLSAGAPVCVQVEFVPE